MVAVLLVLAAAGLLALLAGVWAVLHDSSRPATTREIGQSKARSGRSSRAVIDFREVKALVRAGKFSQSLPFLLIVGGLMALMLFGGLAVAAALDYRLEGLLVAAISTFTVLRLLIALLRA